jgi:hypothetical protein
MNLQSSIRRDGTKVFYLHLPEEVEAPKPSLLSGLIGGIRKKFLRKRVEKSNRINKHRGKK